jgi:putative ABC transport system substrate-binding protein
MKRETGHVHAGLRRRVGADEARRSTRRKLLIVLGAGAFAAPLACFAAQPTKVARVGYLGVTSAAGAKSRIEVLRAGLRELGYVEGKNLVIEFRWADDKYERLPALMAELIGLKVDVIVTHGTPGIRAAKQATTTIPIVMATAGDAVLVGLVANVARPEGNVTGSTFSTPELAAKRLEVLRDTFPRIRRVALLQNPDNPAMGPVLKAMQQTATALKLELQQIAVRTPDQLEGAFSAMAAKHAEALVAIEDPMLNGNIEKIADLAARHKMPSIGLPELADAGGLLAYGVDLVPMFRRAAYFVDKILKGVKVSALPVERATGFELILNMKTAKGLSLKIPESILVRADKVIE